MPATCTPEHCAQADVAMIVRTHTPSTCPALSDLPHDGSDFCVDTTCPDCDCCAEHYRDSCDCTVCDCFSANTH